MTNFPVDSERLGAIASGFVEGVFAWVEKDGRRQPSDQQERDEQTNLPLWQVHALIAGDGDRPSLMAVRVPAAECPNPPALQPVGFERLSAVARVNKSSGQLSVFWSAAGVYDPKQPNRQRQHHEHKEGQPA